MLKKLMIIGIMITCILISSYGGTQVRITGGISMDFIELPDFDEVVDSVALQKENTFWGVGWEVIFNHIGIGGTYMVAFLSDESDNWNINWYGEGLYLSLHFLGAGSFVDPFIQAGIGCAGGVYITSDNYVEETDMDQLSISIFPFVSAGLALDFDGFILGTKVNYNPCISPVPVTPINEFPLKNVQIQLFMGIGFGG